MGLSVETKNTLQQFRDDARERREVRAKVWNAYSDYVLKDGLVPEAAKQKCMERYGYSLVQVNNVLARRVDLSPETRVDMDATIQTFIARGKTGVDQAWDELDDQLHELDIREGEGKTLVTVEVEETTGDKTYTKKKRLPVHEARLRLMERKLEVAGRFMDRLSSIAGKDAMANALGKAKVTIHIDATEQFKAEFDRVRGLGNGKNEVVDVDATVVGDDSKCG